jgi:hypothetical protein
VHRKAVKPTKIAAIANLQLLVVKRIIGRFRIGNFEF